jgi:hypothetical protein
MSLTGKPALTTAVAITNDGFWPNLTLAELMDNYRIPPEYADGVIKTGLTLSIINVNEKLAAVKAQLIADGYATLEAYTTAHSEPINSKQVLAELYKHAVFTRAKAGLLQQFNTLNRKPNAENAAKESDDTEAYWLDESQSAIAQFFKRFLPDEIVMSKANTLAVLL